MTTTTANKGEQECREAFENDLPTWGSNDGYIHRGKWRYDDAGRQRQWEGYSAAWNRRPTNEGQDGLTDARKQVSAIIEALAEIVKLGDQSKSDRDPEVILRPPVMAQVIRIREAANAIARHLSSKQATRPGNAPMYDPDDVAFPKGFMPVADPTKVICPSCVHEFRAIPQDIQEQLHQEPAGEGVGLPDAITFLRDNDLAASDDWMQGWNDLRSIMAAEIAKRDAEIADLRNATAGAQALIQQLRAQLAEAQKSRSMETAPRDGTRILLLIEHENANFSKDPVAEGWKGWCIGSWTDHNGGGFSWYGLYGKHAGWLPLPTVALNSEERRAA